MLAFLKNHPFAVEAFFESSLVLTFAVPQHEIEHLIPECLSLDVFNDEWAFIAVALVQTKHLRPKGLPRFFGSDFFLIGYRVFVRFTSKAGRSLRGLFILKSETDSKQMELFGNVFTHYNYSTTDITRTADIETTEFRSEKSDFHIRIQNRVGDDVQLPDGSPFRTWQEARKYAGPLPYTFTYNPSRHEVLIIEGVRENWRPSPVRVIDYHISFLEKLQLRGAKLANAFITRDIPYLWKRGRIEQWTK